ncbi:MAG TPA: helix-turn-helix domain-containing protein [Thermoplasmata archaeon]|jgi:DNA-binding HxlR family transcriptional regulator|nr:helix-turn-helix domain-containing protein [Thermoplasmata archaeon]
MRKLASRAPADRTVACMIRVDGREYCIDPAGGVADALGKKWTLPLMGVLGNRPSSRFSELAAAIEGVGAKALSGRLRELESLGLVERRFSERPASRVSYSLTDRGSELRRALVPLLEWAAEDPGVGRATVPR